MNTTLVGRLFWKEYRFQRGLWLGIIAILLVIQLTMWGVMPPNQNNPLATLASIGVLLSAFYALGSAAVMFAGEREEGTDAWLRILPVTSLPVCGGKIAWMICSWAAAMGVGLLAAWLLTLRNPGEITLNRQTLVAALTYGGLMPLWGILFSLVCRRVYIAIALAAGALLLTVFVNSYAPGFNYFALAALAVADVALGRRWLLTDGDFAFDRIGRTVRGFTLDEALATSVEPSLWWKYYRRELWLECRQARWLFLGHLVFAFALLSLVTVMNVPEARQISWLVVFGLVPLQSGGMAFLGEQFRERFRFQTNQGVTPSALWCAKQTVWIGLTLLSIGLLFMFWLPEMIRSSGYSDQYYNLYRSLPIPEPHTFLPPFVYDSMVTSPWPFVGITLGIVGLMYSVGQLSSLLFRRSVTAGGIAFVAGVLLVGWLLVGVILNVPLTISVLFPCLAMLGLSLWRTSGWLTERNTVRDGLKIAGIAAMLMFLSYQSWVIWRMLEVDAPRPVAELTALFPAVAALVYGVAIGFALSPPGMLLLLVCLAAGWWRWGRSVRKRLTLRRVLVTYAALHLVATGGTAWVLLAKWQDFSQQLNAEVAPLRPSQEALATGDLYRRAHELLTSGFPAPEREGGKDFVPWYRYYFVNWGRTTDEQKQWLTDNEESLAILLQATARPDCAPGDYFSSSDPKTPLGNQWDGSRQLLRLKALQLEEQGDLTAAWKLHRAGLRLTVHFSQNQTSLNRAESLYRSRLVLLDFDLLRWIKQENQTPELLEQAVRDLIAEFQRIPPLRSSFELEGTHALWAINGDHLGSWVSGGGLTLENMKSGMMQFVHAAPGERTRANLLILKTLQHQFTIADAIQNGNVYAYAPELNSSSPSYQAVGRHAAWTNYGYDSGRYASLWNKTETTPVWAEDVESLQSIPRQSPYSLWQELEFIAARRTVFLRLAAEWTSLKTGKLPNDLVELAKLSWGDTIPGKEDINLLEMDVSMNPILFVAEQYEKSQLTSDNYESSDRTNIVVDPVAAHTLDIDFNDRVDNVQR